MRRLLSFLAMVSLGFGTLTPAFAQGTGAAGAASGGADQAPRSELPKATGQSATGTAPGGIGVIHPPAEIDPGIKRATPPAQTYSMPVLPPPGTPGGKPDVIAK